MSTNARRPGPHRPGDTSGIETVPLLAMIEAYGLLPHDEHEM
jgi:hypothetical protein